jgi:hypothetical protein
MNEQEGVSLVELWTSSLENRCPGIEKPTPAPRQSIKVRVRKRGFFAS